MPESKIDEAPAVTIVVNPPSQNKKQAGVYELYSSMKGEHEIKDVWIHNLEEELQLIQTLIVDYQYIAMDTEFPGTVAEPHVDESHPEYKYKAMKTNVDLLKIIQLGLSLCDATGRLPPRTWQFNFHFDLSKDIYNQDSIDFLKKCGIDFEQHKLHGIDVEHFASLLYPSGIVCNDDLTWITFHATYDYGYLVKLLTASPLPTEEVRFFDVFHTLFPNVYDIKHIMKSVPHLGGGLNRLAEELQVLRIGPQHQAGSDSLLTAATFFKLNQVYFEGFMDPAKYNGVLFGVGDNLERRRSPMPPSYG